VLTGIDTALRDWDVSKDAMRSYPNPLAESERKERALFVALARRFSDATGMGEEDAMAAVLDINTHGLESPHIPVLLTTGRRMVPPFEKIIGEISPNGEPVWGEDADPARRAVVAPVVPSLISAIVQIVQRELGHEEETGA
jgi:hypothetical protein